MTGSLPWEWCDTEVAERFADGLPPEARSAEPSVEAVVDALSVPANESAAMLMVVGFSPAAVALVAGDRFLAAKTLVWFVRPGDLRAMAAALDGVAIPGRLLVGIFEDPSDFVRLVEGMPLVAWSLAVVDPDPGLAAGIQHLRYQRLRAMYFCPERVLGDLAFLLGRGDRVADGVPLTWWKGRFAGATALAVAAGPSLDRHMDFLRRHAADCVVIAVDVVHARLREMGVRIDFAVNVDSHELLASRLGSGAPETVLVMPLDGHGGIDERFANVSYECATPTAGLFLPPGHHSYLHGTNVGAASVGWANHLGCGEVILLGHDLAFDRGRLYASAVAGREALEERNSAAMRLGQVREVPGNDGTTVVTDQNFEAGIRDLGLIAACLAKQGCTVYNPNIGLAVGALIANTLALPAGWTPRPKPPMPSPAEMPRNGIRGAAARLREELSAQLAAYQQRWPVLAAEASAQGTPDGLAELEAYLRICDEPGLHLAQQYLTPFQMGHIFQLYRIGCSNPQPGHAGIAATVGAGVREAVHEGARLTLATLASQKAPEQIRTVWSQRQLAFFTALRKATPVIREETLDRVVLPLIGRDWRFLRRLGVAARLTGVVDLRDALALAAHLGDGTPPELLAEILALCRIATLVRADHALDLAREAGIDDPAEPVNVLGKPAWLAADALLRLRAGTSADPAADAAAAAAWPSAAAALVQVLLGEGMRPQGGPAIAGRLVADGRIVIDDGLAARIIDGHPDVVEACDLLAPFQPRLGETATAAIADRFAAIGQHAQAIEHAVRIRPLAAVADRSYARLLCCLIQLGRWEDVSQVVEALPGGYLRSGAMARALGVYFGQGRGTLLRLAEYPGLRPVRSALVSEALAVAADRNEIDPATVDAALRLVEQSLERPLPDDERKALDELLPALRRMGELTAAAR